MTAPVQTATLFVANDRNRELLAEWLGEVYDVSTPSEPRISIGTDLVLVDDASFPKLKDELQDWKQTEKPVFAPVLLVTRQTQSESFDPSDWRTIDGLYVIDDIVSAPIKKAVLYRRLENLLERRELSQQLARRYRQSEQRFETLFDAIPDPVFVSTDEGVITDTNEAFHEWFGLDDDVKKPMLSSVESVPADAVALIEDAASAAIAGEDPAPEPPLVSLDHADGDRQSATVSVAPVSVEDHSAAIVVLRDVTERRERAEQLRESEARFRQIAEHVSAVIWLVSTGGEALYVSPGYEALTGRSVESFDRGPVEQALAGAHHADTDRLEAFLDGLFEDVDDDEVDDSYRIEYRLRHADGSVRWVENEIYPVQNDAGEVTRLVGIIDDVTDRKRRERRYDAIFNQTFQLTGLLQPDGTILAVNERAVEYLGLDRSAVVGETLAHVCEAYLDREAGQRLREKVAEATDGEFVRYEESVSGDDGTATLDISVKPIRDDLGDVTLLVLEARDVTERKRHEQELARQNDRLEEFASIVSHDLRNPLQVIRARVDISRDTGDVGHLDAAERAVDRMERLIDDLLDLARHGELDLDAEPLSLSAICDRAWMSIDADSAALTVDAHAQVRADPDRLMQLLENLFRNAVEHAGPDVTVRVGATEDGFYVEDDGPGVPEDDRESIFALGHTADSGGTGFGLAIVAEIADAHNWSIDVSDAENGGARFEIHGAA